MLRRTLLVPAAAMTWQKAPMHQNRCTAPTFGEAFKFWLKLGFISFGGPTGQIAIMQTELVEKKRWISQSRFLHAAARPGSTTARHLRRVASSQNLGRHRRRGVFCHTVDFYSMDAELHLR